MTNAHGHVMVRIMNMVVLMVRVMLNIMLVVMFMVIFKKSLVVQPVLRRRHSTDSRTVFGMTLALTTF